MFMCICTYIYAYMYVCIYMCIYKYVYMCICTYVYMCICTYVHIYVHISTYIQNTHNARRRVACLLECNHKSVQLCDKTSLS